MNDYRAAGLLACLSALAFFPATANPNEADLSARDIAWIETCISDREAEQLDPRGLRKYCVCMQQIVEDNEAFSVMELERSYPPAHVMCKGKAGLLRERGG